MQPAAIPLPSAPPVEAGRAAQIKRTVQPDEYKQWAMPAAPQISDDGHWISYILVRPDGDNAVVIRNSDMPQNETIPNGRSVQFSDDSKWCAYLVGVGREEAQKLAEQHKPAETALVVQELGTGAKHRFEHVRQARILKGSRYVVAERFRGAGVSAGGSDLTLLDLANGSNLTIGNVTGLAANKEETRLALRLESPDGEQGVHLLDPKTRSITPLYWGTDKVAEMTWAKQGGAVAFLVGPADEKHEAPNYRVMLCDNLKSDTPRLRAFDSHHAGFPDGKRIAEVAPLRVADDGSAVAFGVQAWAPKSETKVKPEDQPHVQVWNTHDILPVPQQIVAAAALRDKCSVGVWQVSDDSFREIGDGKWEVVAVLPDFKHAVLIDPKPYQAPVTNGVKYQDDWLVDLGTGKRSSIVTKNQWSMEPSETGRYVAYFAGRDWWTLDTTSMARRNITGDIKAPFEDTEDDHTIVEKPPVEPPIWLANDDGLLLTDEFDVWLARTGTPSVTRLTDGRKDRDVYRFLDVDPLDEEGPSIQRPFYFRVQNRDTKEAGFYVSDALGKGKTLFKQPAWVTTFSKSKNTDRVVFSLQTFELSPNIVLTNTAFTAIKSESKSNPQQAQFAWGKAELVQYKSRFGKTLEGTLIYPAGYVAGRTYPLVTIAYERESDNIFRYIAPIDADPYNAQVLSQNGYFVLEPDITYLPREPGKSAVDCLEPALNAVFEKHVGVDPTRVGMIGHSWGGYETAFVTTVSKMFAVGVAGAPLTELTSMYNSFYWNQGVSQQVLFESAQGRMGVPFWQDPKAYIDNSPVWQSEKRTAPLLIEDGDQDGAVPWQQAQYLFQTLRRMGKNAVLLVYTGENHGLSRRADALDYAHRLRHFLDVYLKNAKPQPWVTEGVPYTPMPGPPGQ